MEEIHDFGNGIELVVQLVPETGENNFQYLLFDKKNKTVISIDCFDATRQLSRIKGFSILAALGKTLMTFRGYVTEFTWCALIRNS